MRGRIVIFCYYGGLAGPGPSLALLHKVNSRRSIYHELFRSGVCFSSELSASQLISFIGIFVGPLSHRKCLLSNRSIQNFGLFLWLELILDLSKLKAKLMWTLVCVLFLLMVTIQTSKSFCYPLRSRRRTLEFFFNILTSSVSPFKLNCKSWYLL